jgi:tetratricopeptide (TPR) repeat protein
LVLLAWGTVDQARHYLSLHSDDLNDLKRAAVLDSFDSQLQMRLGRRQLEDGNPQEAEAAWRRAIAANPADPAARQALLKFLLDQKRFDEAFALTETSLKYAPRDANLLVDRGLLALQRGHAEEALADWERALKADPNQSLADLYLAHELDREGKAQGAGEHYRSYLEKVARRPEDRPAPDTLVGIVLRMAECQVSSSQPDAALKSYQMAEKLAQQTGQKKLESMAKVNEARLLGNAGKLNDALRSYRRALELDDSAGDKEAAAVDWFAYGRFLEDAGFPPRMAYACMLKSERLGQSLAKSSLEATVAEARLQLEKRLGAEAAGIRRNPDPVLQDALHAQR